MRLHRNTIGGEYEVYTIYELEKFSDIKQLSGYTSVISNDNVSPDANKFRKWRCINNLLRNYTPEMPIRCTDSGSILQADLRYNTIDNGYYTYPAETWQDIEMIQTGVRPDDWSSNPNYIQIFQFSRGFNNSPQGGYNTVNVKAARCVNSQNESFETTANYAIDTKGKFLKRFTTETGYTFSCCNSAYWNYDRWAGILRESAGFTAYGINANTQYQYGKHLFTRPNNTIIDYTYRSYTDYGITGIPSGPDYNWDLWGNAKNIVSVFVHFVDNSTDFYGVAQIQYDTHLDTAIPIAIEVVAFDSAWWGGSIIPGGGGSGDWGSKSVTGGGNGTWTFSSDSRGDRTGDDLDDEVTARRTALQAFFNVDNGFQLHQLLSDDIQHIFALLYDDNFISRYTTSIFNPLSAVLSLHLLPQRLVDPQELTTPLTLSGYNISSNLPTPKNFPVVSTLKSEHIGDVDLDATDTFLDYAPYTRAYLHLPYIGVVDIDINSIAAGTISVDYITDATTGNCAAFVWCSDRDGVHTYKYVATGNAAYTMPMFAAQQDGAAVGKIVNSTLGLAMSAISGNAAGAISAAGGIAGGIFDAATTQRNTQVTGSFSGNASLISDTVCWLEIVRPVWAEPEHFQQLDGLPSMLSGTIASFSDYGDAYSGYLRVVDLETDGIQAAQDELTEIETLLRSGIFVNNQ